MENCIFCRIIRKELPSEIVYEDEHFIAFLDIKPINKGHSLIVPKKHCNDLLDFPEELEGKYLETTRKVAKALMDSINCDGFNIGVNNGGAAGQVVFHSHTHVIPRFGNDGLRHWPGKDYESKDEMKNYANKIRNALR